MLDNKFTGLKKTEELLTNIKDEHVSDRCKALVEQMQERLNQCEKRAVQRIHELDLVLSREGLQDRAQTEIRVWQERYRVKQEAKEDNFKNKMLDRLKKWKV